MASKYDCPDSCNKCGKTNRILRGDFYEGYMETECEVCGHQDCWEYGFFNSGGQDGLNASKKYSFGEPNEQHDSIPNGASSGE